MRYNKIELVKLDRDDDQGKSLSKELLAHTLVSHIEDDEWAEKQHNTKRFQRKQLKRRSKNETRKQSRWDDED